MIEIYRATVPVFKRGLGVMSAMLRLIETEADGDDRAARAVLGTRLAPDMIPFSGQIQRASDTAKFAVSRLTDVAAPKFPDVEVEVEELRQRIDDTVFYILEVPRSAFEGAQHRMVDLAFGSTRNQFSAVDYVLDFALPNFYFHVAMAHGILRFAGLRVGKLDYLALADRRQAGA